MGNPVAGGYPRTRSQRRHNLGGAIAGHSIIQPSFGAKHFEEGDDGFQAGPESIMDTASPKHAMERHPHTDNVSLVPPSPKYLPLLNIHLSCPYFIMPTSLDAMARLFKGSSLRQGSAGPQLANTTEYALLTGTWLRRHWRPFNLQSGHANIFIIICLCYEGVECPEGGSMTLEGPREDLSLLLERVKYRHHNETRQFLIFTDFEMDFQDHTGLSCQVPTIRATHRNIATRVQGTMQDLGRGDKCLLYYSGHIELDPPMVEEGSARIMLQGDRKLSDYELRTWLALSRFPTTTIIAIFDACHSGGFLALPYLHNKDGTWVTRSEPGSEVQMKSQVIEISSTTKPQYSFSEKYPEDQGDSGTTHGILSWNLLQYLKVNRRPKVHELVSHISSKCDTLCIDDQGKEMHQTPELSSSRKIKGRISIF